MKRSKFSLSHYKLFSCNMGTMVPISLVEVLPGDTFQMNTNLLVRASPLLSPVMHPVHARVSHWFVPHRLVWDDWEDFITGGPDGMDASVFPTIELPNGGTIPSLANFLGIPVTTAPLTVSALPFRAYNLIFNEWYRDQDLVTPMVIDTTSGPDTTTNLLAQNCMWEKDYFTSARPWEQKGPTVSIPLGTSAPVVFSETGATPGTRTLLRDTAAASSNIQVTQAGTADAPIIGTTDLSGATAATVNLLREAMALQRFEEARARYGSRYVEYLRYLGVRASDARLHRPEYLGGGQQTIQFSEVLQTAEGTDPVGELRGHGIGAVRSNRFRRFFEEHGYLMSILSVKPKTIYMQGLERTWNRRVKEDFWQKELQHIGQQEVLQKEIWAVTGDAGGDAVFGYQDRYDEYRRCVSQVTGEFQSTLDFWHFARQFATSPALNDDFVRSVPTEEPFAVPSTDVLYCMAKHSIQARRMVAKTGSSFIF